MRVVGDRPVFIRACREHQKLVALLDIDVGIIIRARCDLVDKGVKAFRVRQIEIIVIIEHRTICFLCIGDKHRNDFIIVVTVNVVKRDNRMLTQIFNTGIGICKILCAGRALVLHQLAEHLPVGHIVGIDDIIVALWIERIVRLEPWRTVFAVVAVKVAPQVIFVVLIMDHRIIDLCTGD